MCAAEVRICVLHSRENIGRKIVKTLNIPLHMHALHIIVQENDDHQIKKNIRLKFPEFSLSFAKFSNSLSFPCREFLLAIFPVFPVFPVPWVPCFPKKNIHLCAGQETLWIYFFKSLIVYKERTLVS